MPRPGGIDQVLLATLEGDRWRVVRIDPEDGFRETVELEVAVGRPQARQEQRLAGAGIDDARSRRTPPRRTSGGCPSARRADREFARGDEYVVDPATKADWHPPDAWVEDAWYLIRYPDGRRYDVRRIETPASEPRPILVVVRSIAVSPFEPGTLYFGGYDPNAKPARDTAWVYSAPIAAALAPG